MFARIKDARNILRPQRIGEETAHGRGAGVEGGAGVPPPVVDAPVVVVVMEDFARRAFRSLIRYKSESWNVEHEVRDLRSSSWITFVRGASAGGDVVVATAVNGC